ncbi:MAG: AarF/UbiB family protein [Myxococcota bacterium]
MWRFRFIHALWCLATILLSYRLQRRLSRLLPRAAWVERRWARVHAANAWRLKSACLRLRGVYIKLGQVLSVMGTFLPDDYTRELETLQDAVPPRPWRVIRRALTKSLGRPPWALFAAFARKPVAAASLAQVHEATLADGRRVAVKVLYPNIAAVMKLDMKVLELGVRMAQRMLPIAQLQRVLDQLRELLERETDLGHEAACLRRMSAVMADDPDVIVPEVVASLSNRSVLTMTFMSGAKITDRAGLDERGLDPAAVATKLVQVFFRTVFRERFFHADPHPGNFFVQRGERGQVRLVMLDLGSATPLRTNIADGLAAVIEGCIRRDEARFLTGIDLMGFVAPSGDRGFLAAVLRSYFERILTLEIKDFSNVPKSEAAKLDIGLSDADVPRVMRALEYPLGWFYLERAILMVYGVVARLAPELNLVQIGLPYVAGLLGGRQAPSPAVAHA